MLIVLISTTVFIFGTDATGGPLQVALFTSAVLAGLLALRLGLKRRADQRRGRRWHLVGDVGDLHPARGRCADRHLEHGGHDPDSRLLRPGHPSAEALLLSTVVICGLVGLMIGSSWTTAATLGVAFVALAPLLGANPVITAGAVISRRLLRRQDDAAVGDDRAGAVDGRRRDGQRARRRDDLVVRAGDRDRARPASRSLGLATPRRADRLRSGAGAGDARRRVQHHAAQPAAAGVARRAVRAPRAAVPVDLQLRALRRRPRLVHPAAAGPGVRRRATPARS